MEEFSYFNISGTETFDEDYNPTSFKKNYKCILWWKWNGIVYKSTISIRLVS